MDTEPNNSVHNLECSKEERVHKPLGNESSTPLNPPTTRNSHRPTFNLYMKTPQYDFGGEVKVHM